MGINRQDDDTFTLGELRKIRGMDLKPKPVPLYTSAAADYLHRVGTGWRRFF